MECGISALVGIGTRMDMRTGNIGTSNDKARKRLRLPSRLFRIHSHRKTHMGYLHGYAEGKDMVYGTFGTVYTLQPSDIEKSNVHSCDEY
jgi:hypothetical protein